MFSVETQLTFLVITMHEIKFVSMNVMKIVEELVRYYLKGQGVDL